MKKTKIEWCDHTVNFWWGCSEVSEACQNCYARALASRFKKDCWGKSPRWLRFTRATEELARLEKSAKRRGVVETVFINSMSDFFDEAVAPEFRIMVWDSLKAFEHLQFLILTKRAKVMSNHIARYSKYIPDNVHFGITAENQARLDERMAELTNFKGKLFLSLEPMLGEIDIAPYLDRIDWVIVGGETGRGARYFNPMWAQAVFEKTHKWNAYEREWKIEIPLFFKKFGDHKDNVKHYEHWWISSVREKPVFVGKTRFL